MQNSLIENLLFDYLCAASNAAQKIEIFINWKEFQTEKKSIWCLIAQIQISNIIKYFLSNFASVSTYGSAFKLKRYNKNLSCQYVVVPL